VRVCVCVCVCVCVREREREKFGGWEMKRFLPSFLRSSGEENSPYSHKPQADLGPLDASVAETAK